MEWTEQLALGLAKMDATHREFIECYNALASAPVDGLLAPLDAFIAHTEAHFDQENRWMEAVKFPGCHRAEHDRVLAVLRDVRRRLALGDAVLARRLVEELPPWFEAHALGMDAALAYHLESIGFDVERETMRTGEGACAEGKGGGCACASLAAAPAELPAGRS